MPLTGAEKNAIAQRIQLALTGSEQQLIEHVRASTSSPLEAILSGISAGFASTFFGPGVPKSQIKEQFRQVAVLERQRGVRGRVSVDPFTGADVVSAFNQDPILDRLLFERLVRQEQFRGVEERSARGLAIREAVIEGLASSAQERGFPTTIDPALRGGVFRPAADQPLQFIEGSFLP